MEFRKSTKSDITKIMDIVKQAQHISKSKISTNGKIIIQMKKL